MGSRALPNKYPVCLIYVQSILPNPFDPVAIYQPCAQNRQNLAFFGAFSSKSSDRAALTPTGTDHAFRWRERKTSREIGSGGLA
jgi:hypothetical protein